MVWLVIDNIADPTELKLLHDKTKAVAYLYVVGNEMNIKFHWSKLQQPLSDIYNGLGTYYCIDLPFRSTYDTTKFLGSLDEWLNGELRYVDAARVILTLLAGTFYRSIYQFQDWASAPLTHYREIIRRAKNAIKWRFKLPEPENEKDLAYKVEAWIGYNLLTMLREFKNDIVLDPMIDEVERALAEILPYVIEHSL